MSATHTTRLATLQQAVAVEKGKARDAQVQAQAAQHEAAEARDALVEAHARGRDIRKAEQALAKAKDKAEDASIKAEASTRRVERAEHEAQAYEAEHARELIAELQPQAAAAVEQLTESARTLHAAHTAWHEVASKVSALLVHVPGARGTLNAPSDHALASVARDLRNFIRTDGEIASPLPHWQGVNARQAEQSKVRQLRQRRGEAVGEDAAA